MTTAAFANELRRLDEEKKKKKKMLIMPHVCCIHRPSPSHARNCTCCCCCCCCRCYHTSSRLAVELLHQQVHQQVDVELQRALALALVGPKKADEVQVVEL